MRWVSFATFAIFCALATGCGESKPTVYPVSGTLKLDGKPTADVLVTLTPIDQPNDAHHSATAVTGPNGEFKVKNGYGAEGVPAGTYAISLQGGGSSREDKGESIAEVAKYGSKDLVPAKPETPNQPGVIPAKYADYGTTPERVEVTKSGAVVTINVQTR